MATLPMELARKPRVGRIPGRQVAWYELQPTYGAAESRMGDRVLLRLRHDVLVSLPRDDSRLRESTDSLPDASRPLPSRQPHVSTLTGRHRTHA